MRKTALFIAMSLDGYIADRDGEVDWLQGHGEAAGEDGYDVFIREVDTVVMGWNTYHQVVTELAPDGWPYSELTAWVVTHRDEPDREGILFTGEAPCELVRRLRQEEGKTVWICGGSSIIQPLVREDLIDEYWISVIPTILGGGLRLFQETGREIPLKLLHTKCGNGITELCYTRRGSGGY